MRGRILLLSLVLLAGCPPEDPGVAGDQVDALAPKEDLPREVPAYQDDDGSVRSYPPRFAVPPGGKPAHIPGEAKNARDVKGKGDERQMDQDLPGQRVRYPGGKGGGKGVRRKIKQPMPQPRRTKGDEKY